MTKKTKRTVSVTTKLDADTLRKLGEAYRTSLLILATVEGIPEAAKPYHQAAMQMLHGTLNDLENRFQKTTKHPLNLNYVDQAFQPHTEEVVSDVQESLEA